MQRLNEDFDPKEKGTAENSEEQNMDEGVFLYNDDGTPMDTSERTYVSVELPEEESPDTTSNDEE